ncbi:MAG: hypothetical protein HZA53_01275 [Planctomycetes bacterium]|nr:hypothetical protein [Planctomycetota bacterium]
MNLRHPSVWIAFFSLVAVSFVAVVDMEKKSPGPLTAVHGRADDLAGASNCSACHGGWFTSMTEACLECHARIDEQIDAHEGLHGRFDDELARRCAVCHAEHHGETFSMVNRASFARAGVPDPEEFDHRRVGWLMDGRHDELACAKCHANADALVLPEDGLRYGGLDSNCATCHADVHEGKLDAVACASCHGQSGWKELHSEGHEQRLPLVGGHGDVDCRACHAVDTSHSLEALGARSSSRTVRTCVECHASPHTKEFSKGAAELAGSDEQRGCVVCHAAEHTTFREPDLVVTAVQHALTGYPLLPPHDAAKCGDCHAPAFAEFTARYPGRGAEQCSVCHADVHAGQFATGAFAGSECTACHDRLRFEPHTFTTEMHTRTALVLDGKHMEAKCEDCHERPSEDAPRTFHGTGSNCSDCHADAHAGFFDARSAPLPEVKNGDCARCHAADAFDHVPESRFDHGRWTGFAIDGAHAQGDCALCHVPRKEPDETKRAFGRVEEHFGAMRGCVTCHADVHAGRFDDPKLPREVAGRSDCARCHVASSFRALAEDFDHGRWTGYPLLGEHAEANCSGCHAQYARADAVGRTWGPARGTACSDCHVDVHEGQFAVADRTDCARCHTSAVESFSRFDHDRDARFALGAQHQALDCGACHKPYAVANGDEVVRYKPLPTECADCHGATEDVLLRRPRRRDR